MWVAGKQYDPSSTRAILSALNMSIITMPLPLPSYTPIKIKLKDKSVHKTDWKQTDGQTDAIPIGLPHLILVPVLSFSYSPIPLPVTSSSSDSPLCTSITPSLFSTPGLNLPLSQILPPVVSLLPPGLPPRIFACTVLLS